MVPFLFGADRVVDGGELGYVLLLGVIFTAVSGYLYIALIRKVTAQTMGVVAYLEVVSGALLAWAVLDEALTWQVLVGGADHPRRARCRAVRAQRPPRVGLPGDLRRRVHGSDRNLALELVRVTESAAMAAGRWIGRGDKIAADQAAVDGMRLMLDTVSMSGVVVIGEGEKDEAPMLYNGEEIGSGVGSEVDVAVDPLEGTRLTAEGRPNAIAPIMLPIAGRCSSQGSRLHGQDRLWPRAADAIDIEAPPART